MQFIYNSLISLTGNHSLPKCLIAPSSEKKKNSDHITKLSLCARMSYCLLTAKGILRCRKRSIFKATKKKPKKKTQKALEGD